MNIWRGWRKGLEDANEFSELSPCIARKHRRKLWFPFPKRRDRFHKA